MQQQKHLPRGSGGPAKAMELADGPPYVTTWYFGGTAQSYRHH